MESCYEFEALISAAVDGEATEAERRALMEHLSRCEGCREAYTQSLLLHDAFSQWEEEAPEDLCASVMERVRKEPRQKKKARRSWMPLMAAAACLALILVGAQVRDTLRPDVASSSEEGTPPVSGVDEAEQRDPVNAAAGRADQKEVEAKDPEPRVGADVTQYGTEGPEEDVPDSQEESPHVAAYQTALPVMTVTCADPAVLTWMEANVAQEGQETESGTVWVIPSADWLKLEVRLQDGGCIYETTGEKTSDYLTEEDLVEIVYCPN